MQATLTRFDTVVSLMSTDEARECVAKINGHMNSARALLLDLYERRGWVALGYQSWRECVTAEFEQTQTHLYRQLAAAEIERRISPIGEIGVIPETHLRPLVKLTPMEQPVAWQEAQERTNGKPTARVVEDVVREMCGEALPPEAIAADIAEVLDPPIEPAQAVELRPRVNAGLFSSATPEWYTPQHIIEAVLGMWIQIDLDPCSNSGDFDTANVPAASYWTKDDNGLAQEWHGRVYMNPPYGDEIAAWVERMVRAYENSEIAEAIALLPARTDTAWYQTLADYRMCFIRGRLKFSGSENGAPFPSVVVYLGVDDANFYEFFGRLGFIK